MVINAPTASTWTPGPTSSPTRTPERKTTTSTSTTATTITAFRTSIGHGESPPFLGENRVFNAIFI